MMWLMAANLHTLVPNNTNVWQISRSFGNFLISVRVLSKTLLRDYIPEFREGRIYFFEFLASKIQA